MVETRWGMAGSVLWDTGDTGHAASTHRGCWKICPEAPISSVTAAEDLGLCLHRFFFLHASRAEGHLDLPLPASGGVNVFSCSWRFGVREQQHAAPRDCHFLLVLGHSAASELRCLHLFIEMGQSRSAGRTGGMLPSISALLGPHTACSSSIKPHPITFCTGTDSHHYSQRWLTKEGIRRQMLRAVQTLEFCLSFK